MSAHDLLTLITVADFTGLLLGAVRFIAWVMVIASTVCIAAGLLAAFKADQKMRNLPAPDHTVNRDYAAFQRRSFGGSRRNSRNHWVA